jgi:hypothetical protein
MRDSSGVKYLVRLDCFEARRREAAKAKTLIPAKKTLWE